MFKNSQGERNIFQHFKKTGRELPNATELPKLNTEALRKERHDYHQKKEIAKLYKKEADGSEIQLSNIALASWNVDSLNNNLAALIALLKAKGIEIACLQDTKLWTLRSEVWQRMICLVAANLLLSSANKLL